MNHRSYLRFRILGAALYDALTLIAVLLAAATPYVLFAGTAPVAHPMERFAFQLYLLAIGYAFFAWFWRQGRPTLGEQAWGLCLRDRQGRPPDWLHLHKRFLALLVLLLLPGFSWLWALFRGQTLHDQLAGTQLILCHRSEEKPSS